MCVRAGGVGARRLSLEQFAALRATLIALVLATDLGSHKLVRVGAN